MPTNTPQAIDLTPEERGIYDQINFDKGASQSEDWAACRQLTEMLEERQAIPPIRWRWFTDPALAFLHGKSRRQSFLANAKTVPAMMEHPEFLSYLWYFIHGPKLSAPIIQGYCAEADEMQTTGQQLDRLCKYARAAVRNGRVDKTYGPYEFYKLALECDLDDAMARSIREAAMEGNRKR